MRDPLEAALLGAFLALALATVALIAAGRRRSTNRALRWFGWAALVALSTALLPGSPGERVVAAAPLVLLGVPVLARVPARWSPAAAAFFAATSSAAVVYGAYLARATLVLADSPLSLALGGVLLALELAALGLFVASAFELCDSVGADPVPLPAPDRPARWPRVALQVPTCSEPPELVMETVRSLVALDYDDLVIQVIDNNTTDESLWRPVEDACAELRAQGHDVRFVHLARWPGFKAGALNWGLAHLPPDVEIVGVVDADYVVEPGYLRATAPHFSDPRTAFVQTPQDYREWQGSRFYRACYHGFRAFFLFGMPARWNRNAVMFCGTMGLVRRASLEEAGSWDESIITEDSELSLRLLAAGGRGVYLPRSYGQGIMPLTYEALRKQRYRWAFGGIQILRKHWRQLIPWSKSSPLTTGQRYEHLMGALWWFAEGLTFSLSLFVAAVAAGLVADRPFVVQRLSGLGVVLPIALIGLGLTRYAWGFRAAAGTSVGDALKGLLVNLSLSLVVTVATARALVEERAVFLRTPKFRGRPALRSLRIVAPELALAMGAAALAVASLAARGPTAAAVAILLSWSALVYGSAVAYALGDAARKPARMVLAQKALLELAPRVRRAVRTGLVPGAALVPVAVLALVVLAVVGESGRSPASVGPIEGALLPVARAGGSPAPTSIVGSVTTPPSPTAAPAASARPAADLAVSATSTPTGAAGSTPTRGPTPTALAAGATATPRPGRSPTPVSARTRRPVPPGRTLPPGPPPETPPAAAPTATPVAGPTRRPVPTPAPSTLPAATPTARPADPVPSTLPAPTPTDRPGRP